MSAKPTLEYCRLGLTAALGRTGLPFVVYRIADSHTYVAGSKIDPINRTSRLTTS